MLGSRRWSMFWLDLYPRVGNHDFSNNLILYMSFLEAYEILNALTVQCAQTVCPWYCTIFVLDTDHQQIPNGAGAVVSSGCFVPTAGRGAPVCPRYKTSNHPLELSCSRSKSERGFIRSCTISINLFSFAIVYF